MQQRFPAGPDVEASVLLDELAAEPEGGPLAVGDPRVADFLAGLARRLLTPGGVRRFPRGLVFHVPPANVDTIFVYSWALSALAGNRNVVRISPRAAGAAARG